MCTSHACQPFPTFTVVHSWPPAPHLATPLGPTPLLLLQVGWGHMPHDILVAIVRLAGPADARACHRVCRAWHHAVRCGTDALTPSAKHCAFPRIRQCFPRVPAPGTLLALLP